MAKGKPVLQTKETQLPANAPTAPIGPGPDAGKVQVIPGNIPVLTIQLLAQLNANMVELGKKLDELIGIAKNG
jgi:hypothetical protein